MDEEKLHEHLEFWNDNYDVIADYNVTEKIVLGEKNKRCRFCSESYPNVSFTDEAHAIPIALDNKLIFTNYECNTCNHLYGESIEDHLMKYFLPYKYTAKILGRKKELKYKEGEINHLVVKGNDIKVEMDQTSDLLKIIDNHTLQCNFVRQSYIPIYVYKALVKMGISLLPENELDNFSETISWLKNHSKKVEDCFAQFVMVRFFPGAKPFPFIKSMIFKRKENITDNPFCYFMLSFHNFNIQIILPSFKNDKVLENKKIVLRSFPTPFDFIEYPGQIGSGLIDLSSHEFVRGEKCPITLHYESSKQVLEEKNA